MYSEDDLLPISALQHLAFCERQWALIHLESAWEENVLTVQGHQLHEKAHQAGTEIQGEVRITRSLRLRSLRLGLIGMADVVEFHRVTEPSEGGRTAVPLKEAEGLWMPLILEYKRGKPKLDRCDEVQVCAQGLCLEEMLGISIPSAAFFYGEPRRRYDVALDEALRRETERLTVRLHELTGAATTPAAEYAPKCKSCSLVELCLPKTADKRSSVRGYLVRAIAQAREGKV